ncbi:UDP-N-acetylmuramate dehydrogenase [Oleiphilus sp. HI0125]|uniref:UDP-N-acetylmuramate dehydrogenase n=1 Tax=Oleiphilus sp. HI0125 TaxID=1822266 RepID=UPI0008389A55|nr:UDP-N-acetylmuramate dehydrogenase [Oleiphilus sp. HI0125]
MSLEPLRKDLSSSNTMALPCVAEQFFELSSEQVISDFFYAHPEDVLILGGGSNVVLPPVIQRPVVQVVNHTLECIARDLDHVVVKVGASVVWDELVAWAVENSYYGLENLSLIPGSVGAAPVQNIGAYGVELKDVLKSVRAFDRVQRVFVDLSNERCCFGYRDSIFKRECGRYVISEVVLRLARKAQFVLEYGELKTLSHEANLSLSKVRDTVIGVRSAKLPDPKVIPNTGSFFKNPVISRSTCEALKQRFPSLVCYPTGEGSMKLAAGWLIENAGLKGYVQGNASVHDKQALVLTNQGGAQQQDIIRLASYVEDKIKDLYGIELEQEPILIRD